MLFVSASLGMPASLVKERAGSKDQLLRQVLPRILGADRYEMVAGRGQTH